MKTFILTFIILTIGLFPPSYASGQIQSMEAAETANLAVSYLRADKFDELSLLYNELMLRDGKSTFPGAWQAVVMQVGKLGKCAEARKESVGGFSVFVSACDFEKAKLNVCITLDRAGKVAGIRVLPIEKK